LSKMSRLRQAEILRSCRPRNDRIGKTVDLTIETYCFYIKIKLFFEKFKKRLDFWKSLCYNISMYCVNRKRGEKR